LGKAVWNIARQACAQRVLWASDPGYIAARLKDDPMAKDRTYSDSEVTERLKRELPRWTLREGHICRSYETGNWRVSLMITNAIGHLAEAAWHHPDILATFPRVEVRLTNHDAGGITDKDFALAKKIEELVQWRPGGGDALTGPPAAHRYLKYD
jgi:4a-hydroxytetrahydrobiopterin dehydratase